MIAIRRNVYNQTLPKCDHIIFHMPENDSHWVNRFPQGAAAKPIKFEQWSQLMAITQYGCFWSHQDDRQTDAVAQETSEPWLRKWFRSMNPWSHIEWREKLRTYFRWTEKNAVIFIAPMSNGSTWNSSQVLLLVSTQVHRTADWIQSRFSQYF